MSAPLTCVRGAQTVENPLRGFSTGFCSLLRAKLLSNCHWQLLILIRCATHRTCSLICIFCQVHALTENGSDFICRESGKLCEAFSTISNPAGFLPGFLSENSPNFSKQVWQPRQLYCPAAGDILFMKQRDKLEFGDLKAPLCKGGCQRS